MLTVLAFAFVIGILVFVHELGHFLAAKRAGIRVLTFQLGFSPVILKIRRGDTDYCLGAIPLGGFVKMAGEVAGGGNEDAPGTFASKTKWQRLQVLAAGPAMNLGLAVALTVAVYIGGHESPAYRQQPATVGMVATGSAAAAAQLLPGDVITRVGARPIATWDELERAVATTPPGRPFDLLVRRGPADRSLFVTPSDRSGRSLSSDSIGIAPIARPQIILVNPGEPGDRAGLRVDDVVLAANGTPIVSGAQLHQLIASSTNQAMTLWVYRNGAEHHIDVAPREARLGITFQHEVALERLSLPAAVVAGVQENVSNAGLMLHTVFGIFTSGASPRELIGPIGMAQLSGQSAKRGWLSLVSLMALLSLNLGLLNLLPIPVLDGGHIFIMAVESVAQRDFTRAAKRRLVTAGLAVLLMLMSSALYNDLARIFG